MKKVLQWGLPFLVMIFVVWFAYSYLRDENKFEPQGAFAAVANNSPFIIEVKNIESLVEDIATNNNIHDLLLKLPGYNSLFEQITLLDSIIETNEGNNFDIRKQPFLVTAGIVGKKKADYIFITGFTQNTSLNSALSFFDKYFNDIKNKSEKEFEGVVIYSYNINNSEKLYYSAEKGILLISKSVFLIESAINQLNNKENLLSDENFNRIRKTSGKNSLLNLFINHNHLPNYLLLLTNNKQETAMSVFKNYADWSEYDLTIKDNELFLNGFTFTTSDNKFLSVFENQQTVKMDIESVLPAETSVFTSFGISDIEQFRADFNSYRRMTNQFNKPTEELAAINKKYRLNIEDEIYSLIEDEFAFAITNVDKIDIYKNAVTIIKTKSKSIAKETLTKILDKHAKIHEKNVESYFFNYKIDDVVSHVIYKMPFQDIFPQLFGNTFSKIKSNYFTFIDNYIVFGNSMKTLKSFVHDNLLNRTLQNDNHYRDYVMQLTPKSNFYFYSSVAQSLAWYGTLINKTVFGEIETYSEVFSNLQAISYQFSANSKKGMVYNDIYLKYDPDYTDKPRTAWELLLDTNILFKPVLFRNHNTGKKEIFIQDKSNKVYLINYAGMKLFEKKLDEPIISEIYQIDYYKNNKLQYLFNTQNKIYILDRKGNFVERYPVILNSPATNGLGLCDYNNTRDYRIFIATKDRHVTLFGIDGNIIDGWRFSKSEHAVTKPVQHFRIEDNDYIVFTDKSKSYIQNRKGKRRIKPKEKFDISINGQYILDEKTDRNNPRLVITDPSGEIYFVYFDKKVESVKIKDFSDNHFFDFKDIDGDDIPDYIFADDNKLLVYNQKKEKLIDYTFESAITHSPIYFRFPNNRKKLGIVTANSNELFLINSVGTLYDGFPLFGNTQFSIGSLKGNKKFNLFVGTNDKILYNYEIK